MPPGAASGQLVPTHARNFGKYQLVLKLATGGMAEIFLARLKGVAGFEKLVVIKRILPHLADEPQFVAMFLDEARIAARISHANVCQVYELGEVDGQYFLAMEYLEGVTLNAAMRKLSRERRLMDVRLAAGVLVQACEGLHHAHELTDGDGRALNLVHRDVSPQNLFVTVDGATKVLDFGIAKAAGASTKTRTGTVKGKYAYMPPEQLKGEVLDRRVDVFALGVVMFEALTGKRLFWRETDFLIFRAITEEPIPRVRDYRPDVPPGLDAAVARALTRSRDERFPTARAFGEAITQALAAQSGPLPQPNVGAELRGLFTDEIDAHRRLVARALGEPETISSSDEDTDTMRMPGDGPMGLAPVAGAETTLDPLAGRSNGSLPRVSGAGAGPGTQPLPAAPMGVGAAHTPERPRSMAAILPLAPPMDETGPTPGGISAEAEAALARSQAVTQPAPFITGPTQLLDDAASTMNESELRPAFMGESSVDLRPARRRGRALWLVLVVGGLAAGGYALARSGGGSSDGGLQSTAVAAPPGKGERASGTDRGQAGQAGHDRSSALPAPAMPDAATHAVAGPPDAAPTAPYASAPPDAAPVAVVDPTPPDPKEPEVTPPRDGGRPPRVVKQRPRQEERVRPPPPPPRDKEPRDEDPPPADLTPGTISIDSEPYATIYIDGKKIGITPLAHISLPPGTHKVRAVSAAGEKNFTITIEPGKEAKGRKLTW
jgi:serine/threonine-protein kinase